MPIRFKVVKRKTRMSAVVNGHCIYALKYLPNHQVFARPETLGIMTFLRKTHAEEWANSMEYHNYASYYERDSLIVIRVETIGRGKVPQLICNDVTAKALKKYYGKSEDKNEAMALEHTVCYPGVFVLE